MFQIITAIVGLFVLIKGKIKLSSSREIVRPQSIYLGLVMLAYAIAISFLPNSNDMNMLIYSLVFYASFFIIIGIIISKGNKIETEKAVIESKNTKRNLIILCAFIALVVIVFILIG